MDTLSAFAMGQAHRSSPVMVFDWHKAAQLIRERKPESASAGLAGDWGWTGGSIYLEGKPVPADDTYTYLASTWATPELMLDDETFDCFIMQSDSPDWDSGTYWPESALAELNKEAVE